MRCSFDIFIQAISFFCSIIGCIFPTIVTNPIFTTTIRARSIVMFPGHFVQLLESEFEEVISSSACPAHALSFIASTDKINVFLHNSRATHADALDLV